MSKREKPIKDHDNPTWTAADFKKSTRLKATSLSDALVSLRRGRGPQVKPKKIAISIRISADVVEHYKSTGAGWQARMEKALLKASGIKT